MAKLAAKVYGDALFELAVEHQMTDQLYEESGAVKKLLLGNENLNQVMAHPGINRQDKTEMMVKILDGRVSKEMVGFLRIILEKDRYSETKAMLDYFEARVKDYKKIGVVYISTPMKVKEIQKKQIEEKILATSPYETLECHYSVEPELMGGMVIRIKDRVVDSSLKTQLEHMSKDLLHLQLGNTLQVYHDAEKQQ
ncbi:MAG: ATP synthase F1 subunit delta [Lachnospiraceae bacterium]|nr:ATP synthase F1 subunit delta [Lachnospiraceae bacterium]